MGGKTVGTCSRYKWDGWCWYGWWYYVVRVQEVYASARETGGMSAIARERGDGGREGGDLQVYKIVAGEGRSVLRCGDAARQAAYGR